MQKEILHRGLLNALKPVSNRSGHETRLKQVLFRHCFEFWADDHDLIMRRKLFCHDDKIDWKKSSSSSSFLSDDDLVFNSQDKPV